MVELPYIEAGDEVILYSLPNCPNCMMLKDKLNMSKVKYKTLMMDTPEGITELRVGGCFAMMAPVLQVNDTFYEDLFS
jgi:glutaredoxin